MNLFDALSLLISLDDDERKNTYLELKNLSAKLESAKEHLVDSADKAAGESKYSENRKYIDAAECLDEYKKKIDNFIKGISIKETPDSAPIIHYEKVEKTSDGIDHATYSMRDKVNYDLFKIDETVPYTLDYNFTFKRPVGFSYKGVMHRAETFGKIYVIFCCLLQSENSDRFSMLTRTKAFRGKLFSKNFHELARPVLINDSGIYAETNRSANDLIKLMVRLLNFYHESKNTVKIYLGKDYTTLHR